jgi:hypothetical protein
MKLKIILETSPESEARRLGYNTDHILFHGSSIEFNKFGIEHTKTSKYIFLTDDIETAKFYGEFVYKVAPKIKKMADLIDDVKLINEISTDIYELFYDQSMDLEDLETSEMPPSISKAIEKLKKYQINVPNYENDDFYNEDLEKLKIQIAKMNAADFIVDPSAYNSDGGKLRDAILNRVFNMGFNCAKINDESRSGASISFVFYNPNDLFILERLRT